MFYQQKEHSNIISNLRATNEPLFTVNEVNYSAYENKEDKKEEDRVVQRPRKKLERNTSAPTPGMLQVGSGGRVVGAFFTWLCGKSVKFVSRSP